MSMIRACLRGARTPQIWRTNFVRFQSTNPVTETLKESVVEVPKANHYQNNSVVFEEYYRELSSMSAEAAEKQADEWLDAIKSLRAKYDTQGYIPEKALAKPGSDRANLDKTANSGFEATEEQLQEYESLKDKEIPLLKNPVLEQCTNLIMRHGKKAQAEKILSEALYIVYLRKRTNPIDLLVKVIDDMAPLMTTKSMKTGIAKALVVPIPLRRKQGTRLAFNWILDGAFKRRSHSYSVRLAEEIISASEGKSSGYDKKVQMHRTAMAQRAYINLTGKY